MSTLGFLKFFIGFYYFSKILENDEKNPILRTAAVKKNSNHGIGFQNADLEIAAPRRHFS